MRWYKHKGLHFAAAVAGLGIMLSACSSSKKGGTATGTGGSSGTASPTSCAGDPPNQIYNSDTGGTPKTGGVLTVLGQGDVDEALDINIGYYTLDYLAYDLYNRPLYTYPSVQCKTYTVVPDIADGPPVITNNGTKYAVTIRKGAMWNTNPPRQVTAADVVLGVKRSCNPATPFNGQPDFADVLMGYSDFCNAFANVSSTSASAMASYIQQHNISGVTVDPNNNLTVDFTLTKQASYFSGVLSLPPFNPAPIESLQSVPASNNAWQTVYSDGPYYIASYNPNKSIDFKRNPVWNQSADPIDHAYVDEIQVSETGNPAGIYQQILTNSPQADMMWDVHVPAVNIPGEIQAKDPRFQLISESSANPWLVFNTISPNENKAMGNVQVRQALSYAIDRSQLIQDGGGPTINPPLTHIIAPGTEGSTPFDLYPYDASKAKSMLASAGFSHLTLKYLYRSSPTAIKNFQTLQALFSQIGVTLVGQGLPSGGFYKIVNPGTGAKNGEWDIADAGWGPDWWPNGAKSWFKPTLDGRTLPPNSTNYGFFNDPKLNQLIDQALAAPNDNAATQIWQQADHEAMAQAALYPVTDPNEAALHGQRVHNCVQIQPLQNCNLANVWLSS